MLKSNDLFLGAKYLLLSFLLSSCVSRNIDENVSKAKEFKVVSLEPKRKIEFSDFAKNLNYVVLEFKPDFFVATIDKMEINDTGIFVLSKIQKTIFIFSKSGKIISKISDFGDGPGKYSGISDFVIDDKFLYLLTNPSKFVYKYDLSGKLLQIIPTKDNYIYELTPVNGGWLAYLNDAYDNENNFNVVYWDSIFSKRKNQFLYIESERRNNSFVIDNYISKSKNNLFVIQNFSNEVFEYKNDSLLLRFEILIDQTGVQKDFMNSFISSPNRAINLAIKENSFTGFKKILSSDSVLFLESMKGAETVSSFISISSGRSISYIGLDFKFDFGIAGNVIANDGENFVMQISENILNDLKDLDLKGEIDEKSLKNEAIRNVIRMYEKESNPVLVFFTVNFSKL